MLRARAPVGQDLGGRWLLDGDEAPRCRHSSTASVVANGSPLSLQCRRPCAIATSTRAAKSSAVACLSFVVFIAVCRRRREITHPVPARAAAPSLLPSRRRAKRDTLPRLGGPQAASNNQMLGEESN